MTVRVRTSRWRGRGAAACVLAALVTGLVPAHAAAPAQPVDTDWAQYRHFALGGGYIHDPGGISAASVTRLRKTAQIAADPIAGDGQAGAVLGDTLLTGTPDRHLAAYDTATLTRKWTTAGPGSRLVASDGTAAYTFGSRSVQAYDLATGSALWHVRLSGSSEFAPPALRGSMLVVSYLVRSENGFSVAAVDTRSHRILWTRLLRCLCQPSSPAIGDGVVVVVGDDAHAFALDKNTGRVRWRFTAPGAGGGASVPRALIRPDEVVLGFIDGTVRAFDPRTGGILWARAFRRPIFASAAATNSLIYVNVQVADTGARDLYALRPADGSTAWSRASGSDLASPTIADDVLLTIQYYGGQALVAWDAATGKRLKVWPLANEVYTEPMVSGGSVYFGTDAAALDVFRS